MSFEILCHLRFYVIWICLRLLQNTIEWFRALRPISGGREGRLFRFDGLLRAPYGTNNTYNQSKFIKQTIKNDYIWKDRKQKCVFVRHARENSTKAFLSAATSF